MKKFGIGVVVVAALAALAGVVAWAENGGADHFSAADKDGNASLSGEEIEAYYRQVFETLDTAGDGFLDRDECDYGCAQFKPGAPLDIEKHAREEEIANKTKSQFAILDADGNDLLSKEEYLGYFKKQMMLKDADKDRAISRKEYDTK